MLAEYCNQITTMKTIYAISVFYPCLINFISCPDTLVIKHDACICTYTVHRLLCYLWEMAGYWINICMSLIYTSHHHSLLFILLIRLSIFFITHSYHILPCHAFDIGQCPPLHARVIIAILARQGVKTALVN